MGAKRPERLGDALLLLLEGVYSSGQLFGPGGPARELVAAADALIDSYQLSALARPKHLASPRK